MKIALIQPSIISKYPKLTITEPLGLAYISAVLKKNGHKVKIIDCIALNQNKVTRIKKDLYRVGINNKNIFNEINKIKPDIIGISSNFTIHKDDALNLAKVLKDNFKSIKIILGGVHPTMEHENLIKLNYIDYIIRGEGEITTLELLNAISNKKSLKNVLGLTYKSNGRVIINKDRPLINNIDTLPLPDRDALDMDFYMKNGKETFYYALNQPICTMVTSRGCPYNCIFCSTKTMWRRRWRPHSAKRVFKEIMELHNKYGAKEIVIYDDSFILNKKRVKEVCNLIIKANLKITLNAPAGLSVWILDEETIDIMKKAGFYRMCMPIESGSENTLKFIGKPVDLEKTKRLIRYMNKKGIWTTANFIIGFPYETRDDIEKTIKYACESGIDHAIFYIAQPYTGTELYDIYKKEGLLNSEIPDAETSYAYYPTKKFSESELNKLVGEARQRFYKTRIKHILNPIFFCSNILPKLMSFNNLKFSIEKLKTYLTSDLLKPRQLKIAGNKSEKAS
ncbi:MAG: radical SAM protein [Candidatus Nanoarchaeia archaeon]|jgi:radical SAM superfamily enzyme YgiQ (UPF0313 family)